MTLTSPTMATTGAARSPMLVPTMLEDPNVPSGGACILMMHLANEFYV